MSEFETRYEEHELPDYNKMDGQRTGGSIPPFGDAHAADLAQARREGGGRPWLNFFQTAKSFKGRATLFAALAVVMFIIGLGLAIALGISDAKLHNLEHTTSGSGGHSGNGNTSTGANGTLAIVSEEEIKGCFLAVHDVCDQKYNATNPIPLRNSTVFSEKFPQACDLTIWWMYCQFGSFSENCPGMTDYCDEENIPSPVPSAAPVPTESVPKGVTLHPNPTGTVDLTLSPSTVVETLSSVITKGSSVTTVPFSTTTVVVNVLAPAPTPEATLPIGVAFVKAASVSLVSN